MSKIYFAPYLDKISNLRFLSCDLFFKKRRVKPTTDYQLYKKAQKRYFSELDLVTMLRKVRDLDNLSKVAFSSADLCKTKFSGLDVISDSEITDGEPFCDILIQKHYRDPDCLQKLQKLLTDPGKLGV